MNNDKYLKLWDKFDEVMQEKGFQIIVHDGGASGYGTLAFTNKDKWIPTFNLCVWPDSVSIHVKNRCGSGILNEGATIAIYSYKGGSVKKFMEMVEFAVNKWTAYNKTNPYIFSAGEDEIERISFDKKKEEAA